jgi:hypothetical protein
MMLIASLVEFAIPKIRMRQKHNSQLANFDEASLRGRATRSDTAGECSGHLFGSL